MLVQMLCFLDYTEVIAENEKNLTNILEKN